MTHWQAALRIGQLQSDTEAEGVAALTIAEKEERAIIEAQQPLIDDLRARAASRHGWIAFIMFIALAAHIVTDWWPGIVGRDDDDADDWGHPICGPLGSRFSSADIFYEKAG